MDIYLFSTPFVTPKAAAYKQPSCLSSLHTLAHGRCTVRSHVLERILYFVIFPHVMLPSLLGGNVLDECLFSVLRHELLDIPWIPQLGSNTQVFTAPHQGVGLAALCRRGNTVRVEVLLFTSRYRHQATDSSVRAH